MSRVLLAGGGTAGHVNPLLAVADELQRIGHCTTDDIVVVGTQEGLESRLVPQAGYSLLTVPRLPLPRRFGIYALTFWPRFVGAVVTALRHLRAHRADVVAGFGGYASAPVYVAAWLSRIPIVIHEANAIPGFANRLGARFTKRIATAFPRTPLESARVIGMPVARSISHPEKSTTTAKARAHFGLEAKKKTLLVTGGSQGARSINNTIVQCWPEITAEGWQILHIVGPKNALPGEAPGYMPLSYCDRMDVAFAAADAIISRAGAATVSEVNLVGLPAFFVPYAVGNGEQALNARECVEAGAALLIPDSSFTPDVVRDTILPILRDGARLSAMAKKSAQLARPNAASECAAMIAEASSATTGGRA